MMLQRASLSISRLTTPLQQQSAAKATISPSCQYYQHVQSSPSSSSSSTSNGGNPPKQWPTKISKHTLKNFKNYINRDRHLPPPPSLPRSPKPSSSPSQETSTVPEPTRDQLYAIALHQSIPFVGFGIMDNSILLLAGEAIDTTLGVTLGISTLCAAAIGNIISDLAGVGFGTIIEETIQRWAHKIESITGGKWKMPPLPELTMDQRALRSVRWSSQMGCAVGITVGCIIGMFPLLFYDPEGKNEKKHHQNEEEGKRKNNLIDPKSDGKEDVVKGGIVGAAPDNSKLESSSSVNNIRKTENEKQSALEKESSNLDGILLDTVKAARKAIGAETVNLFLVVENPTPSAALEQSSKSTTSNPNNGEGMKAQLVDTKVQSKTTRHLLAKYSDLDTQIHSTDKLNYSLSPLCIPLENADDAMQKCACNGEVVLWNGNDHDNIDASDNANPENVTELITAEESATSAHGSFSHTPNFEHMLCVPIIDAHGKVVGVIQALNKKGLMKNILGKTSGQEGFTAIDSWKLQSMAMQLSLAMMEHSKNMSNDD